MKNLESFILEKGKYDQTFDIPPFEYQVLMSALKAYKDNDERKKNQGNGHCTDEQLEKVIKFFDKGGKF